MNKQVRETAIKNAIDSLSDALGRSEVVSFTGAYRRPDGDVSTIALGTIEDLAVAVAALQFRLNKMIELRDREND